MLLNNHLDQHVNWANDVGMHIYCK